MFPFVRPLNIHPPGAPPTTTTTTAPPTTTTTTAPPTTTTTTPPPTGCLQACDLQWNGTNWNPYGTLLCPENCFCSIDGAPESPSQDQIFESSCSPIGN